MPRRLEPRVLLFALLCLFSLSACPKSSDSDAGPPDVVKSEGLSFLDRSRSDGVLATDGSKDGRKDGTKDGSKDGSKDGTKDGPNSTDTIASDDLDSDGLSNEDEKKLGTNPWNKDTDGDGIDDKTEVGDPQSPKDSDGDKKPDAIEPNNFDSDKDGTFDSKDANDGDGPCGASSRLFVLATLNQDRTLTKACSPYRVHGYLWLVGATLSSEPGVTIEFGPGAALMLGNAQGTGSLKLSGTSTDKIRLTSEAQPAKKGAWRGIVAEQAGSVQFLQVQIEGAGGPTNNSDPRAAIYLESAKQIGLSYVTISEASGYGLHAGFAIDPGPLFTALDNTTFTSVEHAAQLHIRHLGEIGLGNNFGTTGTGGVVEVVSGIVNQTAVWKAIGVPYLLKEPTLTVEASLTLEAGVALEVPQQAVIDVAYSSTSAALHVVGTSAKPVRIGTASGTAGSWNGILLHGGTSDLAYTTIVGAGHSNSAGVEASLYLAQDAKLAPNQVTVKDGTGYGVYFYRTGNGCTGLAISDFIFSGTFPGSATFPGCKLFCLDDNNSPGVCHIK